MTKLIEEPVVLKVSKLFNDREDTSDVLLADNDFLYSLEKTASELLGDNILLLKLKGVIDE